MSVRINLLPYRDGLRRAARRQFNLMVIASAGAALAIMVAVHGVMAGRILQQDNRNELIKAENKKLDEQISEIKRLQSEIDEMKARMRVIESLQTDRYAATQIMDQMVRLAPQGVYLKSLKQQGEKVTVAGFATSQEIVADFMNEIGASPFLQAPSLVEIKAATVGASRLSEFVVNYRLRKPEAGASQDSKNRAQASNAASTNTPGTSASAASPVPVQGSASAIAPSQRSASSGQTTPNTTNQPSAPSKSASAGQTKG